MKKFDPIQVHVAYICLIIGLLWYINHLRWLVKVYKQWLKDDQKEIQRSYKAFDDLLNDTNENQ
jgi:hypothetical protein